MLAYRGIPSPVVALFVLVGGILMCASIVRAAQIDDRVNDFPVVVNADAFQDQSPGTVDVGFKIYFPVDRTRYVPIDARLCLALEFPPGVDSEPELIARPLTIHCEPRELTFSEGGSLMTVKGAVITVRLAIAPVTSRPPGVRRLTLTFPLIERAFTLTGSRPPPGGVTATVDVLVWRSLADKIDSERRVIDEQVRLREKARLAGETQRLAEEAQAQRAETAARAEAAAQQARRERLLRYAGMAGIVFAIAGAVVFIERRWLFPTFRVTLPPGASRQYAKALNTIDTGDDPEPGVILATAWARPFFGRRQRLKVETMTGETPSWRALSRATRTTRSNASRHRPRISDRMRSPSTLPLAVLVTVGASVKAGTYLARLPSGSVLVTVDPASAPFI